MGITIAFKGKLNNPGVIYQFCEELSDIAGVMNWGYHILDEDYTLPNTAYFERTGAGVQINGHLPLKGIGITIHPEADPLCFYFDKYGNIRNMISMVSEGDDPDLENEYQYMKTQFAPIEVHIAVIKLLRYIKLVYINNLSVYDEGSYWETDDEIILDEKHEFLNKKIDEVRNALENGNIREENSNPEESLVDKIEKILLERFDTGEGMNSLKKP